MGKKVADCISLFSLDCSEVVPIDTHMFQLAVKLFKVKKGANLNDTLYFE